MLLISGHILDACQKLRLFGKSDNGMDIDTETMTSLTTQYQESFLKYVENEYCAKHRRLPVITPERWSFKNLFIAAIASRGGQSSYNPYDLSSDDEDYSITNNVAERMPRRSNLAAHLLTAARKNVNSMPE